MYIREPQEADSFMEGQKDIMVTHRIAEVPLDLEEGYLAHLLCLEGTCRYRFNERDFKLHTESYPLRQGGG